MDIETQPASIALFVGTWVLQSYTDILSDGSFLEPMGSTPQGLLLYTKEGIVSAQLAGLSSSRKDPTPDEPETTDGAELRGSYIGYCGGFTVNLETEEVIHTPIVAHDRRLLGRALHRKFQLDADRLTLTTSSVDARIGVIESRLVWCRRTVK